MFTVFAQAQVMAVDSGMQEYHQLIFWGAIVLICCVPPISYYLFHWRKAELEAELKRDMIAQGMSADEIERVLNAPMSSLGDEARSHPEFRETRMHPENGNA